MRRLDGKVAVVIGGSQGIGAAIVERFAQEGASVVIGDPDEASALALVETLPNPAAATYLKADAASAHDHQSAARLAQSRFGRLDIYCQNAGIAPYNSIEATTGDEWDRVMAVNLKSCFLAIQACLPAMKAQRSGRVIFTASITGPRVTSWGHGHYGASKAGIVGLIRTACIELAPYGITVNGVEPGNIATPGMHRTRSADFIAGMESSVPLGRLGTPTDVANAFVYLASDEASYVTGTTIVVDGGQTVCESKP